MNEKHDKPTVASRLTSLITMNWTIKLLALLLAITIYQAIKSEISRNDRYVQPHLGTSLAQ